MCTHVMSSKKLADANTDNKHDFGWTSQLRYYWIDDDLMAQMVAAKSNYGYEYLEILSA